MKCLSVVLGALAFSVLPTHAEEKTGIVVTLDKFSSRTPENWRHERPNNRLRSYQFRLPGETTAKDAELFIFPNLTRSVEENFTRYKEMFAPPEGKTVDDLAKTAKLMVGKAKVNVLDMEGTWLYKERPFDPKSKQEARPDSRVIFVIFTTDDGNYLIRLGGPLATVKKHAKPFYDWIKAFKE